MEKIESKIQELMATVFEMSPVDINENSNQDNIDCWDSVRHLDLVTTIEEEFDIEFPIEEIGNLISFKLITTIVKEQIDDADEW